jgi:hypothetical protein
VLRKVKPFHIKQINKQMKSTKFIAGVSLAVLTILVSCKKDESPVVKEETVVRATPEAFSSLRAVAIESKIQDFQFDASINTVLTTANAVQIVMNANCLTKDGNPITGMVDIKVVELFERGAMLTTNKPTMGKMPNGDKAILISGGEFFINATQNGANLELDCPIQVVIPTDLTGGGKTEITLWSGRGIDNDCDGIDNDCDGIDNDCDGVDDDCDGIVWEEVETGGQAEEVDAVQGDRGENYDTEFGSFGWTNVDKFNADPRPKTTLLVDVPNGFDDTNSSVYISYNGEPNALGNLDTYIESTGLYSEHYGQIPIGLECHIIFVSEEDGDWLYAIESVTIADGEILSILDTDLSTATSNELEALINNLL